MVTQKPIVGCKMAVFQRYSAKFYCETCKKLQNPPFFGFFGGKSPHFNPEGGFKPDFPCRGQPYAKAQTAVAKWGYLYLSAGGKLGRPTCGRFRHRPSGVRAAHPASCQHVHAGVACYEEIKKRNQTHNGGTLLGGISPRPALAIPPPAKTKESNNEGQKKSKQTTTKGRLREREGL